MIKYRKKITITERKKQAPNERKFHKEKNAQKANKLCPSLLDSSPMPLLHF